jgi:hypothetical protein
MADNTEKKQHGRPFQKGESGNPGGRPVGSRNKTTIALESLLENEAAAITQKAIDLALDGDRYALRLVLERIIPPGKSRPIQFELPPVKTASDVATAQGAIISAMSKGNITPDEAHIISGILEGRRKSIELIGTLLPNPFTPPFSFDIMSMATT